MKKLFLLLACIGAFATTALADNKKAITVEELPANAQTFIKTYFPDATVMFARMEPGFFGNEYDVYFNEGCTVEFNSKGEWKEVDCKRSRVPMAIIPKEIYNYVSSNRPELYITKIERDMRDYEVELNNGSELKFDLKFNLVDYDD